MTDTTAPSQKLARVEPWDQGPPRLHGPAICGAGTRAPFFHAVPE